MFQNPAFKRYWVVAHPFFNRLLVMTCLNISGKLIEWTSPIVMGILNVTPDSFYDVSRCKSENQILQRVQQILGEGGVIVDVGGCSTRPNGEVASEEEEWLRLEGALRLIRQSFPDIIISLDTFRATIARKAIDLYDINIINDVSGGDQPMYQVAAEKHVPYVLTYTREVDSNNAMTIMSDMIDFFERKLDKLHQMGVCDVILDPGFGFGKSTQQNLIILRHLSDLQVLNAPILAGISRKSMIWKTLNTDPAHALTGTIAATMLALEQGSLIVRAHDVLDTQQTIQIYQQTLC